MREKLPIRPFSTILLIASRTLIESFSTPKKWNTRSFSDGLEGREEEKKSSNDVGWKLIDVSSKWTRCFLPNLNQERNFFRWIFIRNDSMWIHRSRTMLRQISGHCWHLLSFLGDEVISYKLQGQLSLTALTDARHWWRQTRWGRKENKKEVPNTNNKCLCLVCKQTFFSFNPPFIFLSISLSHPVTSQSSAPLNLFYFIYYINDDALHQKSIIKWLRRKKNICLALNAFRTYVLLKISKSLILLILEFRRNRLIWRRYWKEEKIRKE